MKLSELEYNLPADLIAQEPLPNRDDARLQIVDRKSRTVEHSRFYKLHQHLREGDLLILNDTRVFPARLKARKESGGEVELLLLRRENNPNNGNDNAWLALCKSHRPLKDNARLLLEDGTALRLLGQRRTGRVVVAAENGRALEEIAQQNATLALPHYIRREVRPDDSSDYQTVYARQTGAIAAPTAGLHFSEELLQRLRSQGVRIAQLTLHIGPGTFVPIRSGEVESHSMEAEWYSIPDPSISAIDHARRTGGRIVAVGTSVTRALESYAITADHDGFTGLFIHPGFRFKLTDAMITNFHMPHSTVLALVMAFAGRDVILNAYRDAIRHRYRFLSYGDAMLIV